MKWLRTALLALLASLLFGLLVGTWLRLRMERPTWYIGATNTIAPLAAARTLPGDVGHAGPPVLDPRHHEEQVRQAVHVA